MSTLGDRHAANNNETIYDTTNTIRKGVSYELYQKPETYNLPIKAATIHTVKHTVQRVDRNDYCRQGDVTSDYILLSA